jgi:hypothetical protein
MISRVTRRIFVLWNVGITEVCTLKYDAPHMLYGAPHITAHAAFSKEHKKNDLV